MKKHYHYINGNNLNNDLVLNISKPTPIPFSGNFVNDYCSYTGINDKISCVYTNNFIEKEINFSFESGEYNPNYFIFIKDLNGINLKDSTQIIEIDNLQYDDDPRLKAYTGYQFHAVGNFNPSNINVDFTGLYVLNSTGLNIIGFTEDEDYKILKNNILSGYYLKNLSYRDSGYYDKFSLISPTSFNGVKNFSINYGKKTGEFIMPIPYNYIISKNKVYSRNYEIEGFIVTPNNEKFDTKILKMDRYIPWPYVGEALSSTTGKRYFETLVFYYQNIPYGVIQPTHECIKVYFCLGAYQQTISSFFVRVKSNNNKIITSHWESDTNLISTTPQNTKVSSIFGSGFATQDVCSSSYNSNNNSIFFPYQAYPLFSAPSISTFLKENLYFYTNYSSLARGYDALTINNVSEAYFFHSEQGGNGHGKVYFI